MRIKITRSEAEVGQIKEKDRIQPFENMHAAIEYIEAVVKYENSFQIALSKNLILDTNAMTVISDVTEGNNFKCTKRMDREDFKEFIYERI